MSRKPPLFNLPKGMEYVDSDNWSWEYPLHRKADYILYWNIQIASRWLKENNIDYRVTSIDGRSMVATDDFQVERANLKLVNDRIVEITYG